MVVDEVYHRFQVKRQLIQEELERLNQTMIKPARDVLARLKEVGVPQIKKPTLLADLLKRPEVDYTQIYQITPSPQSLPKAVEEQVEIQVKYEGYIRRQSIQIEQFKKLETLRIPDDFDYKSTRGLKTEACEKLAKIRPRSIGQASRIPGVSPADISILMVLIHQKRKSGLSANTLDTSL